MREIVFDTETTGLNPQSGDRIVELGCVELFNHVPTGRHFHHYINPERDVPSEAFRVHGLSSEFLSDKPLFANIAKEFLEFIGDAKLIAHNASFDMNFINHELSLLGFAPIDQERVIDTLVLARKRHPFGPNSLDALCQRYGIDNSRRTKHGALLDSEILADVYLELLGGRQTNLGLATETTNPSIKQENGVLEILHNAKQRPNPLEERLDENILARHAAFMASIKNAVWSDYIEDKLNA
jgi:DNA polymerase III subunit epsilon